MYAVDTLSHVKPVTVYNRSVLSFFKFSPFYRQRILVYLSSKIRLMCYFLLLEYIKGSLYLGNVFIHLKTRVY